MVIELKKTVHSCTATGMLYPYPAGICQHCMGQGIDFQMSHAEMNKENVKRQFEKKIRGGG